MPHQTLPSTTPAGPASPTVAVRVDNLTISYRHHPAVHHLSCHFDTGSLTAVVGPNGAGKSSLLEALVGRVKPNTGRVELALPQRGQVAYLPQQAEIDRSFPLRVIDVVMLGAWPRLGLFRGAGRKVHQQAVDALLQVGLEGFDQRLIGELSVGQFQRVLFARVLVQDAPLILLDEPFNAIDARTTADLLVLVRRWHLEGRTVVAVLHDMEQVQRHFPRALLMARECLAHGPTHEVLSPANLQRARNMAEHWDESARWCHRPAGEEPLLPEPGPAGPGHHGHKHTHDLAHGHVHGHPHSQAHDHHHGHDHGARPTLSERQAA